MNRYLLSITAFWAVATFTMPVHADVETFQVNFGVTRANSKNDNQLNTTATTGNFHYFLSPVAINKNQPVGEAAFIQRVSNFGANATSISYEDKTYERAHYGGYGFGGIIYSGDWYLSGATSSNNSTFRAKTDTSKSLVTDASSNALSVGFYFMPLSTVTYSRSEATQNYTFSQGFRTIPEAKTTNDSFAIRTLLLLQDSKALTLNGSWTKSNREQTFIESNKIIEAGGQYYPNPKIYFGVGYRKNSGDNASSEGNQISYGVGFTTNHRLLFSIQATKFTASNSGVGFDSSSLQASAHYRF